jgi:hypothetical protein
MKSTRNFTANNSNYNNTWCILQLSFSITAQVGLVRKNCASDTFVITESAITYPNLIVKNCLNVEKLNMLGYKAYRVTGRRLVTTLLLLQFSWYNTGMLLCQIMSNLLPPAQTTQNFAQTSTMLSPSNWWHPLQTVTSFTTDHQQGKGTWVAL